MANTKKKKSTQSNKNNNKNNTKKTTKKTSKAKTDSSNNIEDNKHKNLINEVKLLAFIAISLILFLSNFNLLSPVGDYLSYFMFGLSGFLAYILPIVIFAAVMLYLANKDNNKIILKIISIITLFLVLTSLLEMFTVGFEPSNSFGEFYFNSADKKVGGGIIGAVLLKLLGMPLGQIGTYIVIMLLFIISLVLLTEKSFLGGVKKGSKKVYENVSEDLNKIKENKNNKYKKMRMDKKVKGVVVLKLEDTSKEDEQLHEITPEYFKDKVIKDEVEKVNIDEMKDIDQLEVYKGHVELPKNMENNIASKVNYILEQDSSTKEENSIDEEGFFKPKEKIEVSKSAINEMNRRPFMGNGSKNKETRQFPQADIPKDNKDVDLSIPEDKKGEFLLPNINILTKGKNNYSASDDKSLRETAAKLQKILEDFGVNVTVAEFSKGPSVTRFELQPETGTKVSKITSLADDIKLNLAASDIRIEAPIPGKAAVGIEVPNEKRDAVMLRDLVESKELSMHPSKLAFAAGKDISGNVIVADIAKMPHMLIAGTTGSGKSVFTNSIIMSILFRAKPEEVRLIIIDPKVVEFGVYNKIPHLLQPVVTDPKQASTTLKWAVAQMSDRYKRFAALNVRDLKGYNDKIDTLEFAEDEEKLEKLPQIVIIIDELADLMMAAAKEVEESICRLAQLARAAGIHLIIATQRPSVDVVTGLIKANVPSRVALLVSSGTDSRTIIDMNGAEKLLGNGDMLFYPSGYVKPVRVQGAYVSDKEVLDVVTFLKNQGIATSYDEKIAEYVNNESLLESNEDSQRDEYFEDAARFVIEKDKASASMLQRVFKIGFNRAARIIEQLSISGVIGEEEGTKPRKVLMSLVEFENFLNDN